MNFTIAVYQQRSGKVQHWKTVGLGQHNRKASGRNDLKLQQTLSRELKLLIPTLDPEVLESFQLRRGLQLLRLHLELSLRGTGGRRKVAGIYPLLVEPRWVSQDAQIWVAYHPERQHEWFPVATSATFLEAEPPIEEQASLYFGQVWADEDEETLKSWTTDGKDRLGAISFTAQPRNLMDKLPRKPGLWDDLKANQLKRREGSGRRRKRSGTRVLHTLGTNLTLQAIDKSLPLGMPRSPYRGQLDLLLGGQSKTPVVLIGPPGCGKTTLIHRWIDDLLVSDDYENHRNLDRIHEVWSLSGKRIIAGMSRWGDWEQRCLQILADARGGRRVLYIEDLAAFGRIGRSRESDRSLAQFFQSPLARREILMIGECTPESFQKLEDDAPAFADLFTRLPVLPTSPSETMRMMLHESRRLELENRIVLKPFNYRMILELTGSLLSNSAFPGKALDFLRELARNGAELLMTQETSHQEHPIDAADVLELMSAKTGLPLQLLQPEERLDPETVESALASQVAGQPEAVAAVTDLILRIRTGLADPKRPYGVLLFTGPTGTGKTELAKSLASYLYGNESRLLRFDMGEYGTDDGAARLVGDRWNPEGLLTQKVREQPFCVILFDEIEKADRELLHLLLQLFDEGRLTDAAGQTADFTHAVLIMTSNLGSRQRPPIRFGEPDEGLQQDVDRAIRDFFPPELFNRIDRIVHFRPLTREAAARIVDKELAKLLARPGLTGRNIFVTVSNSARNLMVEEGCDPRYGARPLKRTLEQRLGTLLTKHITAGTRADLQLVRIYESRGTLHLGSERLEERQPENAAWALETLIDAPLTRLRLELPEAIAFLRQLMEGPELAALVRQIRYHLEQHNLGHVEHADTLYDLDSMRHHLEKFHHQMEDLLRAESFDEAEHLELNLFGSITRPRFGETERYRLYDRRHMLGSTTRPGRDKILQALAEIHFLRRALSLAHDTRQHAVFIELMQVGSARAGARFSASRQYLIQWLEQAYCTQTRGELVEWAWQMDEGGVLRGGPKPPPVDDTTPASLRVLKLVGLGVLDLFGGETGSHIWQSSGRLPEIVRVRVLPAAPDRTATDVLRDHQTAVQSFQKALEQGESDLPDNPEALLPIVRQYRYEPSTRPEALAPIETEDFLLGTSMRMLVRNPAQILQRLWLLRMSRR